MIRKIDRLIIKELYGPWMFGVGLFSALLIAVTYLNKITEYFADQVPPAMIWQLILLLLPAVLVKTFTMAVLLAALLGFGRLSADSEIVALRAGGASIYRIVFPVVLFSIGIAAVTFWFDEQVVPSAATRSANIIKEIAMRKDNSQKHPLTYTKVVKRKLRAFITAEDVEPATQTLKGVTVISYDENESRSWTLLAKRMQMSMNDPLHTWRIEGGGTLVSPDWRERVEVDEAWPQQIADISDTFKDLTAERRDEFDTMSMADLKATINTHKQKENWTDAQIANAEYGYWNKLAVPFAALVFGTLGAVLGIRNHRTGTAAGFALAVAIIFGYFVLANFMNIWAQRGLLPPYAASFAPITVGLFATIIILWRRNA